VGDGRRLAQRARVVEAIAQRAIPSRMKDEPDGAPAFKAFEAAGWSDRAAT
jgi:hypothetical protein